VVHHADTIKTTTCGIYSLAASYKIVYLNALQDIPADMRKHLDMAQTEKEFLQTVRVLCEGFQNR
jgi:hypothetical protein